MPLTDIDHAELLRMIRASSLEDVLTAVAKCCQAQAARARGDETEQARWLTGQALADEVAGAARVLEI